MHIPDKWRIKEREQLLRFIDEFGFGILVSKELEASHLPFVLAREEGEQGCLHCHFARTNPHWKLLEGQEVLVIFNGPHAYISPTWYRGSPNVPTWNYATVYVYGRLELVDEQEGVRVLERMMDKYEPGLSESKAQIPDEYRHKLMKGIVPCRVRISRLEGKAKLGQHRKMEDQQGVMAGLEKSHAAGAGELRNFMRSYGIGTGTY